MLRIGCGFSFPRRTTWLQTSVELCLSYPPRDSQYITSASSLTALSCRLSHQARMLRRILRQPNVQARDFQSTVFSGTVSFSQPRIRKFFCAFKLLLILLGIVIS